MATYVFIAQILVAVVLMLLILLQAKGSSFSGAFTADSAVFRTRRGVEKVLFQFTIALAVIFVILAMVTTKVIAG